MRVRVIHSIPVIASILTAFLVLAAGGAALCAGLPEKGAVLPALKLTSPTIEGDSTYLGIKGADFELKDIEGSLLIIEIIGVYCPYCYEQAPLFNKFHGRLGRKKLSDRVKMLAIAAGGSPNEAEYLRKNGSYEFPVISDEKFTVHKLLGEPRTPFTIVAGKDGKVLYTHPNILEDTDSLMKLVEDHLK